jgi:hypothetical protein
MSSFYAAPGFDLSSMLDIGLSSANSEGGPQPVRVDPTREYVASAFVEVNRGYLEIEKRYGGPLAWHGVEEYERMYHTPIAGSCINAIRFGVLANEVSLLPVVRQKNAAPKPGQRQGTTIEADLADEICESNKRLLAAWDTPVEEVLWEHMEDLYLGHVMSEVIADDVVGGPDDGLLAIKSIKPKHRKTYQFRVDRAFNVLNIKAMAFDKDGNVQMKVFDPDHFLWSTNEPYRGDPRGRSSFRAAHYHWRLLMDLWPEVWEGWKQFGVPIRYGTTAPNAKMVASTGKDGKPVAGSGVTAEFAMAMSMAKLRNSSNVAGPNGSDIKVVESTKDSSVASGGIAILQGQIIRSLLLQEQSSTEPKHSSKALGEVGQDTFGTVIRGQRKRRERFVRRALLKQNTWNYGADIARRCTPLVDLGGTEHQDFAANAAGVGLLWQASFFTEDTLPEAYSLLGFTPPAPDSLHIGPNGPIQPALPAPDGQQAALPAPATEPTTPATPPPADQANQTAPSEGVAA